MSVKVQLYIVIAVFVVIGIVLLRNLYQTVRGKRSGCSCTSCSLKDVCSHRDSPNHPGSPDSTNCDSCRSQKQ